jgi:hypothetical protein
MQAANMPIGTTVGGYEIARNGEKIGYATASKMHDHTGGWGAQGEDVWVQEPGSTVLADEKVDWLIANGANVRLGTR